MNRIVIAGLITVLGLLVACVEQQNADRDQSIQSVTQQHRDIWSEGKLNLIPDVYTEDYVGHFPGGEIVSGREGISSYVEAHHVSFPDWNEVILDIIVDGDSVATRYRSTGTHRGEFLGIPPTGNTVDIPEASIYRMVDGKIAEQWAFPDVATLQMQLAAGQLDSGTNP
jgi:steroid delta-isomerase-like uncharacterized protein